MLILPAIDLMDGRCVRLLRGEFDSATQYGDPFVQLRVFGEAGAEWAHMVDLDGARQGAPAQRTLIGELARASDVRLQCGGGVRTRDDVAALLQAGIDRVVVGSVAVKQPQDVCAWLAEFGAERICVALDVRASADGWDVATEGWTAASGITLSDALASYPQDMLRHVLVTDISRDGALAGANVALMETLTSRYPNVAFQASGGVAALEDLVALKAAGASAAIVGRALYERRLSLEAALAL